MRPILALGILLLGLSSAAPEPEYSSLLSGDYFRLDSGDGRSALAEIESSTGRADRLAVSAFEPHQLSIVILRRGDADGPVTLASADPDATGSITATATDADATPPAEVSIDDLCQAMFTSAQNHDLPVPFFANLLWQESRLHADDVSNKGAMGIAQFMPQAAVETGLDDPFDPLQAIPASARLLQKLRLQFGNLGFVAAAYNAGPQRVIDWLEHRKSLPKETRTYVVRVTGLSVDAWRSMAVDSDALTFVQHLPCRSLPVFAGVEQEQMQQAQQTQVKWQQAILEQPVAAAPVTEPSKTMAESKSAHHAARDRHPAKHEAAHALHAAHEKHKSA